MRIDQLSGDGEAEPGAVLARHALERLEEMGPRPLRYARPGVAHVDHRHRAFAAGDDGDLAIALALALKSLHRIAAQIAQHAEQLVAVSIDPEVGGNVQDPSDAIGARQTEPLSDLDDQGGKLELLAPRRRLLRLAEIEGAGAKPDGAVERSDQLRHELLHAL